ncbi:hypothetical protein BS47DRAFT_1488306 [Hydnum rufescens UP504]|uniref:Uncharacterized protein n=1 Tax=Hydnum rufescens UP504 TaxID=1448309 RepID=A0A9P6AMM8_9AGAM|nr:hypothetical protein BS47DRAFT_1488306 [Hydnum rufescens UP504]
MAWLTFQKEPELHVLHLLFAPQTDASPIRTSPPSRYRLAAIVNVLPRWLVDDPACNFLNLEYTAGCSSTLDSQRHLIDPMFDPAFDALQVLH